MKFKIYFVLLSVLILSCSGNDDQKRLAETKKEVVKKEITFATLTKSWVFYDTPINATSEKSVATWNEFRVFLEELSQKPKKTIGAFQKKARALSKKATALNNNIPIEFATPALKSRISILITKVHLLDLYLHLDRIPDQKIKQLIGDINKELVSMQRQMDKIDVKSKIPVEEGESDLKQMMDTSRAISTSSIDPNLPRVE